MTSWLREYSSALEARDAQEHGNSHIIRSYTKLADRVCELETAAATATPPLPPISTSPPKGRQASVKAQSPSPGPLDKDAVSRIRSDLQNTQRARQTLQSQLSSATSTVTSLRSQLAAQGSQVAQLARTKELLERKVKDRNEEIKGKGRLATEAQDEMVALQLQLNVLEKQNEDLKKENQMLVQRWMTEMGQRAEKMNLDSKWE
ncbi:autophagy protein 16 [Pseudovirgaria hyperparasitica]|uniref:Autophagy protein 16 n=1 Tax=Pseudovirgaria hyperparasitica TaxID=470096 RepID=A0A6A6W7R4_9PEZI|nr:autophagy protein 16 [Pseudovirgaria hyperparasitica]KAF2758902.1 autophagy protein 16 [Pseudovirgaria hyperparasitica]